MDVGQQAAQGRNFGLGLGQVGKVVFLLGQQLASLVINGLLRAAHEAAQRVERVLLGVEQGVFGAAEVGEEPVGVLGGHFFQGREHGVEGAEKRVLGFLGLQLQQLNFKVFELCNGFVRQGAGFVAGGGFVKKLGKKVFERAHLRGGEFDLGLQHQGGVGVGVAQAALQGVMLQGVRVLPYLDLAARAQQGQVAQDGGVVPAVAFAFKALQQAFDGGTRAALCVGVDEGQHLLFRLGDVGVVVDQQAVFHHAQVFADVGLVVGHVAQHAQVGVGALNQVFKAFEDAGLAVFTADLYVGRVDDERGLAQ